MDEDPALASFSLTHVSYNPNDKLSYLCAWLALVPQALMVVYMTLMWSTREAEVLTMFLGQMGCEAVNFGLKRWIKEERPKQMNGKGYGMPSSHAQFLAYFAVYATLFLLFRHKPRPIVKGSTHSPLLTSQRIWISFLLLLVAAAVAESRIYLNYHTPKQVLVGVIAGTTCAIGWFSVIQYLRWSGRFDRFLDSSAAQSIKIRDLTINEHFIDAGWDRWQSQQQAWKMGKKTR